MITHVVNFCTDGRPNYFGARDQGNGYLLVDLRLFVSGKDATPENLAYQPDKLRAAGVPDYVVEIASKSDPQGFIEVPKGYADEL
jgi:hypothetical protein